MRGPARWDHAHDRSAAGNYESGEMNCVNPVSGARPFEVVRCLCDEVLFDGYFKGIVRIRCRQCGQRVWIGSNGDETRLLGNDRPKRNIVKSLLRFPGA